MFTPNDVILLLEKWLRRPFAVDIRKTDIQEDFSKARITTDRVHHISEINETTDACLDSATVQALTPASNTVRVIPGRVQWFEQLIEIENTMESPILPPFTTKDCDPLIVDPIRWSLLCVRQNQGGDTELFWAHGTPGEGYPEVPYDGVPLALVKSTIGAIAIEQEHILNWRCIRPGYAPGAKFQYPPVYETDELALYNDPVEGAQCFVMNEGVLYFYQDGDWHRAGMPTFDNAAWYTDITTYTARINLPWAVRSTVEILVFRDGQLMLLGKDYDVMVGPAAYIMFTYNLAPGQRIVILRNPFMSQAYSPNTENGIEVWDIYVNGETGNDAYDGTSVNPFKTLHRGFEVVPSYSNRIYKIHATNLKLDDRITIVENGRTTYGYMRGKRAVGIVIDIDSSHERDPNLLNSVATLYDCAYVTFAGSSVDYDVDLVGCLSGFVSATVTGSVSIQGGYAGIADSTAPLASSGYFAIGESAYAEVVGGMFRAINVGHGAFARIKRATIYDLMGYAGGYAILESCNLREKAIFDGATLQMESTDITATGTFTRSYVSADRCTNNGNSFTRLPEFFTGRYNTTINLRNTKITYILGYGVSVLHGSTLHAEGGHVRSCAKDGIYVGHSSSAHFESFESSYNTYSGVRGEYSSAIKIESCVGYDNNRWGCECYNLSRAEFTDVGFWGSMGGYYEQLPGADTVVSQLGTDMSPGALDTKITVGSGLKTSVKAASATDYKFHVELDTSTLAGPGKSYVINTNAYQSVTTIGGPVTTAAPDVDVNVHWPGTGFISSVCQKIYNPTTRTKFVPTTLGNRAEFLEMDETIGTDFQSGHVVLYSDPFYGYKINSPYWFMSKIGGYGTIPIYGTQQVTGFSVSANAPAGTSIKIAFGTIEASDWLTWNASMMTWDPLPGSSTLQQLQSAPEYTAISSWSSACWDLLRLRGGDALCVCFLLTTTSSALTPEVFGYTWQYIEDGYLLDITHAFERRYFNNRAIFTYDGSLGDPLNGPLVFSVIPTADRDE